MPNYDLELVKYARRQLTSVYAFAVQNSHLETNLILKNQIAELLAFASDNQICEIGKRLNGQPNPSEFITKNYGAWLESKYNPARFSVKKPSPKPALKNTPRIITKRKYF